MNPKDEKRMSLLMNEDFYLFKSLSSFEIQNIDLKIAQNIKKGQKVAQEILQKCREVTAITSYLNDRNSNSIIEKDVFKVLLQETSETFEVMSSIQYNSLKNMLNFLLSDIKKLCNAICRMKNNTNFDYVCRNFIPNIFQHFSNYDSTNKAFSFYTSSLLLYNTSTFTKLVSPFYNCPAMYHFCDKMKYLLQTFQGFVPTDLQSPSKKLVLGCLENFKYLPTQQLKLLRMLHERWKIKDFWLFIVNNLIIPNVNYNKLSLPFVVNEKITYIFDYLKNNIKSICKELEDSYYLNPLYSLYDIPVDFETFNMIEKKHYILSTYDISILLSIPINYPENLKELFDGANLKVLKTIQIELYPKKQSRTSFTYKNNFMFQPIEKRPQQNNQDLMHAWLFLKSKVPRPVSFLTKNKLSGNNILDSKLLSIDKNKLIKFGVQQSIPKLVENTQKFEMFIATKQQIKFMEKWKDEIDDYLKIVSAALANSQMKYFQQSMKIWYFVDSLPNVGYLKYWAFLYEFNFREKSILMNIKESIEYLDNIYTAFAKGLKAEHQKPQMTFNSRTLETHFWKTCGLVSGITINSSFITRYSGFEYFLNEIYKISELNKGGDYEKLFSFCMISLDTNWIFKILMEIQNVGLFSFRFHEVSSDKTIHLFQQFIGDFYQLIQDDIALSRGFSLLSFDKSNALS